MKIRSIPLSSPYRVDAVGLLPLSLAWVFHICEHFLTHSSLPQNRTHAGYSEISVSQPSVFQVLKQAKPMNAYTSETELYSEEDKILLDF